jgi:hypothetical protein
MQFRVTAALVAVFAILAASVAYFDLGGPAPSGTPTVAPSVVLDVPLTMVTYAEVTEAGKTAAVARKDETTWEIVSPSTEPADNRRVEDALGRVAKINATRKIDEPGDLSAYGLAQPTIRVELRLSGSTRELLVGNKTPDNSSYYVKTPEDGAVYVVSSFAIGELTRWLSEPPRPRPSPTAIAKPTAASGG